MAIWALLALQVVLVVVAAVLRPKPDEDEDRELGSNTPRGTPVPLVYGRVRLTDPTTLWYGGFTTKLKNSGKIESYNLVLQLGLCLSDPMASSTVKLYRIRIGDVDWYTGPNGGLVAPDAGTTVLHADYEQKSFFGRLDEGGGFYGTFEWFGGSALQARSTILGDAEQGAAFTNATLPGYQGLAHWVFDGNIGEVAELRPMTFEVESMPDALGYGAVGSAGDANPAEVLWSLLGGDWGRADYGTELLDKASFQAAAAVLDTEGHGIALAIRKGDAREAVQAILKQIDGLLYEEPSTRKLTLALIRNDYTVASLPLYDESDVVEVLDYVSGQLEPTSNQVRVTWTDRAASYQRSVAVAQDPAGRAQAGRTKSVDYTFAGVTSSTIAQAIADRELQFLSRPLVQAKLLVSRRAATLRPGDVIRFAWSEYGITGLIMRVLSFDLGTLDDGRVTLNLVQDPFSTGFDVTA